MLHVLRRLRSAAVRDPLPYLLGLGVFVLVAGWIAVVYLTTAPDQRLVDLEVYRDAGISVLTGRPVYDWLTASPQLLPFTYPPISAILAIPLAFVPLQQIGWLWTAMQMALLLGIVAVAYRPLTRRFGRWSPVAVGAIAGLLLWELPLRDGIRFGQVDIVIVALCLADYLVRSPRWPRGLLIGIATAIKLTPGVFILHLWLSGRRREAVTAATTAIGLTVAAFLLIPTDSTDFWLRALFEPERLGANANTSNQSLRGMLLRLGLDHELIWLALVALLAWYGLRVAVRASRNGNELAAIAAVGLLAVLLSPVAWIHHLAWIAVVLAVIVGDGSNRRRVAIAIAVWALFYLKIPWWGAGLYRDGMPLLLTQPIQDSFGLLAIALLVLIGRLVNASGPAPAAAAPDGVEPERVPRPQPAALPGQGQPGSLGGGDDREQREQTTGQPAHRR
jgi:alpha-1,2-mannosyltransferase